MSGTRHTTKSPRKRSCSGKRRHLHRWQAEQERRERIAEGAYEDTCTAYGCRFCGGFHVGHTTARKYRARAGR